MMAVAELHTMPTTKVNKLGVAVVRLAAGYAIDAVAESKAEVRERNKESYHDLIRTFPKGFQDRLHQVTSELAKKHPGLLNQVWREDRQRIVGALTDLDRYLVVVNSARWIAETGWD